MGNADVPHVHDVFEENDIGDIGGVRRIGAIYWSFPADGRPGLSDDIRVASALSYTVARQREQVAKLAAWTGFEVAAEVAVQFDLSLGLEANERARLAQFLEQDFDAAVIVGHDAFTGWRPNKILEALLRSVKTLRVYPPSDLNEHFIWNRHWKKQSAARAAARRSRTRYQPSFDAKRTAAYRAYMAKRIERWPDWNELTLQQKAERLSGSEVKTISGLRFNVERVRDFEQGMASSCSSGPSPVVISDQTSPTG